MRLAVTTLVVVLGLVVTGGLLASAVVYVQHSAARQRCMDNLREVAQVLERYHDTRRRYPAATIPNPDLGHEDRLAWTADLGQFSPSRDAYLRLDLNKGWDGENRSLALTINPTLQCPNYPERVPGSTLVPTHYVGVAGLGPDAAVLPLDDPRAGFFGHYRELTRGDVSAGTGSLVSVIETQQAMGAWTAGGPPTVRGLEADAPGLGADGAFGGHHRGGTHAAFADGSVRALGPAVDAAVLQAMVTIRGSGEIEPPGE